MPKKNSWPWRRWYYDTSNRRDLLTKKTVPDPSSSAVAASDAAVSIRLKQNRFSYVWNLYVKMVKTVIALNVIYWAVVYVTRLWVSQVVECRWTINWKGFAKKAVMADHSFCLHGLSRSRTWCFSTQHPSQLSCVSTDTGIRRICAAICLKSHVPICWLLVLLMSVSRFHPSLCHCVHLLLLPITVHVRSYFVKKSTLLVVILSLL